MSFLYNSNIGNNRNLLIKDKIHWSLDISYCRVQLYKVTEVLFLQKTIALWKGNSVACYDCLLAPLTLLTRSEVLHFDKPIFSRLLRSWARSLTSLTLLIIA